MPLHYPPIRLGQQAPNHHGSSSGGLSHHQNSSASLLSREDSSVDICITGEKSHFVRQHSSGRGQTPRLGSIRNIASPIPHPINSSSFSVSSNNNNQETTNNNNNSTSINTNNHPLDPNLSNILKEHLDESLINFLQQNPNLIDSSAISLLNLVNKQASNNNQQPVQPQTSLPEHTSHSQHQGIPNLTVNNTNNTTSNNNETSKHDSSSQPKITIIREYKQHTKTANKSKKKPKYVPPTMDKAVRKKEDKLCALVVPNKQSVEFPDEFEFNEKHKSFVYNPEPTKTSFLERLSFLDNKRTKDRSLNYSVANQKEGNPIELFSNNDISYYNKSDFLLASEKFVKTEKERNNGSIPQWNKITDNIPMGFIDDLNADYIIQPVDRSTSVVPEEVFEEPAERETFFITGLDETNNPNNSLSKTQKSNHTQKSETTLKSEMPELPSRISTPNYMLFTRDGTNLSQMSQHSQRSASPNVSVNLSRPHSTLSHHSVPSNNYLSNHSLIYQENAPPRPNTSMDRTAALSAKKKWNVFPPRQKIIVNNPSKPINSFVAEQSMNLSHSSSRMDFSRSATPLSTLRTKSSMSSRSAYSTNSSQSDSSEQEEIVIRLPDQCLISAVSKPIISKPTPPLKQHSIFNKSQDRTFHANRELFNTSPINNQ